MVQYTRNLKVLGIDPGTTRLGYALVEGTSARAVYIDSGVFGNKELSPSARLYEIHTRLVSLIQKVRPDRMALEKLFFSKNVKTALSVAEARGVILLTAQIANLRVYEYAPQEVKIALTSRGDAKKPQVAAMAKAMLKMTSLPQWDDESDAIAIALTGLILGTNREDGI